MDLNKIGIIGYGEAGTAFAGRLSENKSCAVTVFDIKFYDGQFSQILKNKAAEQNLDVVNDIKSLILNNDLILSVVTGEKSKSVVGETLPYIADGKIYVGMNTVSARILVHSPPTG